MKITSVKIYGYADVAVVVAFLAAVLLFDFPGIPTYALS